MNGFSSRVQNLIAQWLQNLLHLDLFEFLLPYSLPSFAPPAAGEKMGEKKTKESAANSSIKWCPLSKRYPSRQN